MLHIGVLDGQDIMRYALKHIISELTNSAFEISELGNLVELRQFLVSHANGVVILDPYCSTVDSQIEQVVSMRNQFTTSSWLLCFKELNESWLRQFLGNRKPQFNILFKDDRLTVIKEGLLKTLCSERYVSPRISNKILEHEQSIKKVEQVLTNSEREILKEIASGKMTKEIASDRSISVHTVITHRKNIFKKLGVNNVHDATRYAIRAGIITVNEYYI